MFEIAFAASLIVGFFRGGSLKRLSEIPLKFEIFIISALIIQIALSVTSIWFDVSKSLGFVIILFSYLVLLSGLFLNRKNIFIQIIIVGVLLNFLVIAANGGMPVSLRSARIIGVNEKTFAKSLKTDFKHVLITDKTNLNILGDIVPIPPPYPLPALYSLGDIFMSAGLFLFIQSHMAYRGKRTKENEHVSLLS